MLFYEQNEKQDADKNYRRRHGKDFKHPLVTDGRNVWSRVALERNGFIFEK